MTGPLGISQKEQWELDEMLEGFRSNEKPLVRGENKLQEWEKPRKLIIIEAYNGYILQRGGGVDEIVVVEERDDTNHLFRRLLEAVAESFGMEYNPFSDKNLNITFDKVGDECENHK
uniref:Uncharacterized protein n=1 Tax=viral metagenome TaxID=1070528 RepID=A0A6M3XWF0_9ZZZZ